MLQQLSQLIGIDARFILYPVLSLIAAGVARLIVHRYLSRWASKTQSELDDKIVLSIESIIIPLVLISVLYFLSGLFPLPERVIVWMQRGLGLLALLVLLPIGSRLVSMTLGGSGQPAAGVSEVHTPASNALDRHVRSRWTGAGTQDTPDQPDQ